MLVVINKDWQEDPDYPLSTWKHAVQNGDTRLGYWDWIDQCKESQNNETFD